MSKPKTFSLHWGSGVIEEEAQIETPYHRPTVQLLKFIHGDAAGSYEIRLCHYDLKGRFQRSELVPDCDRLLPRSQQAHEISGLSFEPQHLGFDPGRRPVQVVEMRTRVALRWPIDHVLGHSLKGS